MTGPFPGSIGRTARRHRNLVLSLSLATALAGGLLRWGVQWSIHGAFPESTLVTARDGSVLRLTTADDGQYRLWTPLNEFSPETVEAVLLKEDRTFWYNAGVDAPALGRAAWNTLVTRDYRAGASTVTMQTIRLAGRLDTSTIPGKLVQIAGALALTALVPKAAILEAYLNLAPCGANIQGLGTASRIWLAKPVSRLNLSESLALAVLPQDPSGRNPSTVAGRSALEAARQRLAAGWLATHPDPQGRLAAQLAMPLSFRRNLPFLAPHLTTRLLEAYPDRHRLATTVDPALQRQTENAIRSFVRRNTALGVNNAAALVVRADTMEVLASVGSADFWNPSIGGQVDGTRADRSPGSTLKPFLYGLALEQGLIHPLTTLKDARIRFGGYNPDNFDNDFEGPIRAVDALVKSRNVPAVILTGRVRNPDLYGFLQEAGLGLPFPRDHYGLSLILGGAEVTMAELVRLYGTLAGSGNQAGTTRELQELAGPPSAPTRLLTAPAAWLVRRMLATKPRPDTDEGWAARSVQTDSAALLGRTGGVAYKTGTSIGFRDAWSVGIADGLIVAVWVGDFAGTSNPEYIGLKSAAPLMFELVDGWRAGRGPQEADDPAPDGVVFVPVCSVSGGIATDACPQVTEAPFIAGVSPIGPCTVHQIYHVDQTTGLRRSHAVPGITRPVLYEVWPSDLLELFAQAGLARAEPPAADPDDRGTEGTGDRPPQILSPVDGVVYQTRTEEERLPLAAAVGSDARTVWWFIDERLVGQTPRGEPLLWPPEAGRHRLRVVDDLGRHAERSFDVAR